MSWRNEKGFNFRQTVGFVTDGTRQTYVLNQGDDTYPRSVTIDSDTFNINFTAGTSPQARDRNDTVDPRCAGMNFVQNSDANPYFFDITLPVAGKYVIRLGAGDTDYGGLEPYIRIMDGTSTVLATLDKQGAAFSAGEFMDAAGTVHASAAAWVSSNAEVVYDFATTTLRIAVGTTSAGTGTSALSHVSVRRATSDTRYVHTGSSAGGTGKSNATSGADRAFASLSEAETALRQDLTGIDCNYADPDGDDTIALAILCTGTTADTANVSFGTGWTTDSTHRILVALNGTGAGAKWDTGLYRLITTTNWEKPLEVNAALHLVFKDLQVDAGQSQSAGPVALSLQSFAWYMDIVGGFYRCSGTAGTFNANNGAIRSYANAAYRLRLRNVTMACHDSGGLVLAYCDNASAQALIYNCTAVSRGTGSEAFYSGMAGATTLRIKNLLVQGGNSTSYTVSSADEEVTILTEDASSPTTSLRNKTVTFVDEANWDYHLASSDTNAIDAGTDLSADSYWPFSDDGDGVARSGSWDVGADEYVAVITTQQEGFRWRNDDGSESAATWKAAQDTNISAAAGAARLRILLNTGIDLAAKAIGLKYSVNGGQRRSVN